MTFLSTIGTFFISLHDQCDVTVEASALLWLACAHHDNGLVQLRPSKHQRIIEEKCVTSLSSPASPATSRAGALPCLDACHNLPSHVCLALLFFVRSCCLLAGVSASAGVAG